MKRTTLIAALVASAFSVTPLMAQQTAPPPEQGGQMQQAPDVAEFDKQMAQMQENMQRMQEQMEKIGRTSDPQERQKLLQEHWETMQNGMTTMHGMWGPGMMGCCSGDTMMGGHMMGWRGMGDYYSKLTPDQLKQRQYMMNRYMGMQQQMMDHMMQRQNYMWMQPPR